MRWRRWRRVGAVSEEQKRQGREVDHSPQSSSKIKSLYNCISAFPWASSRHGTQLSTWKTLSFVVHTTDRREHTLTRDNRRSGNAEVKKLQQNAQVCKQKIHKFSLCSSPCVYDWIQQWNYPSTHTSFNTFTFISWLLSLHVSAFLCGYHQVKYKILK